MAVAAASFFRLAAAAAFFRSRAASAAGRPGLAAALITMAPAVGACTCACVPCLLSKTMQEGRRKLSQKLRSNIPSASLKLAACLLS